MNNESLTARQMKNLKIQFLFVTANKLEQSELKQRLVPYKTDTAIHYSSDGLDYTIGYLGSYLIAHIHLPQQGAQKSYGALLCIEEAYRTINPLCVIMVGVAFGRSSTTQNIGDVLLSQNVQPYHSVRRSTGENGELLTEDKNEVAKPGYTIMRLARNFADWVNNVPLRYKVHVGTILAGEELIDHEDYKNQLISAFATNNDRIVGGEMEAAGLAAVMNRKENTNWLVIKAICDWADGSKKEKKAERQELAARNAVDFCVRLLNTDNLSKLPNFTKTKANYNEAYNKYMINGYKMFYARNKHCYSIKKLSKKTKIIESELRDLENFHVVNDKPIFRSINQKKAKKIQQILNCSNDLFEEEYTDHEKYFFGNKSRHSLCPPEPAKAVIFDFDGTLTIKDRHFSTWQRIWARLGYDPQICEALHRKYTNEEITHEQWCEITADYFIKKNLKRDDVIQIAQDITLLPGTAEVLEELKNLNIPVYICSGSIDIIIESVLGDLKNNFSQIVSNQFAYDSSGSKLKTIISTAYDFEGKSKFIKKVAKNLGISTNDIVFVGNSNNDEFAISSGAKTLVINPKLTSGYNRDIWRYSAGQNVKDLRDILPFILPNRYLLKEINI